MKRSATPSSQRRCSIASCIMPSSSRSTDQAIACAGMPTCCLSTSGPMRESPACAYRTTTPRTPTQKWRR